MTLRVKIVISLVALLFVLKLYRTNKVYPIFDAFKTKDSSNAWLMVTIYDFYIQTLSFSLIVYNTEDDKKTAIMWILLNCIIGSPVSILYLLTKNKWFLSK